MYTQYTWYTSYLFHQDAKGKNDKDKGKGGKGGKKGGTFGIDRAACCPLTTAPGKDGDGEEEPLEVVLNHGVSDLLF